MIFTDEHLHELLHEAGLEHSHEPDAAQHSHAHTHTQTKAVLNRMSRLIGHLNSIKNMIESGRDCSEVLIQLSAVSAAIKAVSKIILKDHIEHCMIEAIEEKDYESLEMLVNAIDKFI